MPILNEIVKYYIDRLKNAGTEREIISILNEIDNLVYESSRTPISLDDKEKILQLIYDTSSSYAIKHFDNKNYLQLVHLMLQQIRANKK
jgi:replicative DNA helicase